MALSQLLVEQNFPAIAIHKAMSQDERLVLNSLHCQYLLLRNASIFTARRIASAVLTKAIPPVRPSVTRWYCVKTTARSTMQFALSDSKMCLVL